MSYYIGLDGGSTYLKAALLKDRLVIDTMVCSTGIDNNRAADDLVSRLCEKNGITTKDISYTMATGYSRKILSIADDDISEITAHAYGVRVTAPKEYRPGMIIDIGGQDSKIIYLDSQYSIKNFTMNDKCAAGTGKFMEVAAQILETTIDQVGPLSLESTAPCDINSTCVVFAQSEIISLIARKFDRKDILAGMHISMAKRIVKMMKKSEKNGDILMTGGGALNVGIRKAFEEELMKDVYVASHPQFNGAIGAPVRGCRTYGYNPVTSRCDHRRNGGPGLRNLLQSHYQHLSVHLCGVPLQWSEKRSIVLYQLLYRKTHQRYIPVYGGCGAGQAVYQPRRIYWRLQPPAGCSACHEWDRRSADGTMDAGTKAGKAHLQGLSRLR